jgi:hypothetical protein
MQKIPLFSPSPLAFFSLPLVGRVGVGDCRCVNVKADWCYSPENQL